MKTQINEIKRMQQLAGIINEDLRKGVYNDFAKWKESFPEGTEFKQENGYMVAKDKEDKELGKWNPTSMHGMHADDFQYKSLEEVEVEEIKVGETYIAQMPTSNDGKERIDVKVKVLAQDKKWPDHFIIEFLESKRFTNPVSKMENSYTEGNQNSIEAKYLKPIQAESFDNLDEVVDRVLEKLRSIK